MRYSIEKCLRFFHRIPFCFKLTVFSLTGFTLSAAAQQKNSVYVEPVVGFHTRWIVNQDIYGNAEMDYATTYGMSGGFRISYFPDSDIGLNAGFGYRKMGQNYEGDQRGASAKRQVRLDYIQMPLMVMFALSGHEYPTWFSVGPNFCFLTKANQYFTRDSGGAPLINPEYLPEGEIAVDDRYNKFDLMVAIEFNKMFRLDLIPRTTLNCTLETAYGIFDINSKPYRIPNIRGIYEGSHNMFIGLRFGLMFNATK